MAEENITAHQPEPEVCKTIVDLDEWDRAYLEPLIADINRGEAANRVISAYIGTLARRGGMNGIAGEIVFVKDLSAVVVVPSTE